MCKLPPVEKSGAALDISTRDIFPKILKLAEQAGIFGESSLLLFLHVKGLFWQKTAGGTKSS